MSSEARLTRESFDHLKPILDPHPLQQLPARVWTEDEWAQIRRGRKSESMDGKWDVFTEDDTVFFHRSWTGYGVFELVLEEVPGGGRRAVSATVERDQERYRSTNDELASVTLELIVNRYLLEEPAGELDERFRQLVQPSGT